MRNFSRVLGVLFLSLLSGCANERVIPDNLRYQAAETLRGACYTLFTNGYQYTFRTATFRPDAEIWRAVFALTGDERSAQACGTAYSGELNDNFCLYDCAATWSQIEALALTRCEDVKKQNADYKYGACKVFARNNEIIWKKDAKFQ